MSKILKIAYNPGDKVIVTNVRGPFAHYLKPFTRGVIVERRTSYQGHYVWQVVGEQENGNELSQSLAHEHMIPCK